MVEEIRRDLMTNGHKSTFSSKEISDKQIFRRFISVRLFRLHRSKLARNPSVDTFAKDRSLLSLISKSFFFFYAMQSLSSVLLLPLVLLPGLASGPSFVGAERRQQQLDQPEEDVDERRGDDNQNERDVNEMTLIPG